MSLKVLNSKVDRYSLGFATSFYKKKELVSKKRPNVIRKWAIQIYTTFRQKEKKKTCESNKTTTLPEWNIYVCQPRNDALWRLLLDSVFINEEVICIYQLRSTGSKVCLKQEMRTIIGWEAFRVVQANVSSAHTHKERLIQNHLYECLSTGNC